MSIIKCFNLSVAKVVVGSSGRKVILTCALFVFAVLPTLLAGEFPARSIIEQGGKRLPFYTMSKGIYRELEPREAADVKPGVRVAFVVKLEELAENRIYVYGDEYLDITFMLAPGVTLPSTVTGTNMLLGGIRDEEKKNTFIVQDAALMPDDLVIYQERIRTLAGEKGATAEDYFDLGDWIGLAKNRSQIVKEDIYQQYVAASRECYAKGLALLEKRLVPEPAAVASHVQKIDDYLKVIGDAPQGRAAAAMLLNYQKELSGASGLGAAIKSENGLTPEEARKLAALELVQIGELHKLLLDDAGAVKKYIIKAAALAPDLDSVKKAMPAYDYVMHDGKWITVAEMQKITAARNSAQAVRQEEEQAAAEASVREKERLLLLKGEGFEAARHTALLLVGVDDAGGLPELVEELPKLPLDVARTAVFQAGAWFLDEPAAVTFMQGVMAMENPVLRLDGARLLTATGNGELVRTVLGQLYIEKDQEVMVGLVDALWHAPGAPGVSAMIEIVSHNALPAEIRGRAASYLAAESGEDMGLDAFAWKRWWAKGMNDYQRRIEPGRVAE